MRLNILLLLLALAIAGPSWGAPPGSIQLRDVYTDAGAPVTLSLTGANLTNAGLVSAATLVASTASITNVSISGNISVSGSFIANTVLAGTPTTLAVNKLFSSFGTIGEATIGIRTISDDPDEGHPELNIAGGVAIISTSGPTGCRFYQKIAGGWFYTDLTAR